MIELAIIIVNWNTRQLLAECIRSLYDTIADVTFEIWVVDNASTDGSPDEINREFPAIHLIRNADNVGFARANNQAMTVCNGRYFLLINSDAVARPGAVRSLLELARREQGAGVVGAKLLNVDGTFQASYTSFPGLFQEFMMLSGIGRRLFGRWYPSHGPRPGEGPSCVDYVEGACLLVNRDAYSQVGGLDEGYFMYAEEVDWCFRMKEAGWQVWYEPAAEIVHHGGASSNSRRTQREADLYQSRVRFFRKCHGAFPTAVLKWLMLCLTTLKFAGHGAVRFLSGGRRGRQVVAPGDLLAALHKV